MELKESGIIENLCEDALEDMLREESDLPVRRECSLETWSVMQCSVP